MEGLTLTQTTILQLYQYNSVTDSTKETAELIDNISGNMGTIDTKLGPFVQTKLYVDEDGDVCQLDDDEEADISETSEG